jgi:protein-tyrosine phosphatase
VNSILFICTGNIFRSLVAEYALKAALRSAPRIVVGSAGIQALPQPMHPLIRERLLSKGADPSSHVQRKLTRELLEGSDLPVAMGLDHQEFVRLQFDRDVLLFNQICYQRADPVLDVHEAIPDWHLREDAARAYALSLVDYIWDSMPSFLAGLQNLRDTRSVAGEIIGPMADRSAPGTPP